MFGSRTDARLASRTLIWTELVEGFVKHTLQNGKCRELSTDQSVVACHEDCSWRAAIGDLVGLGENLA
jgi:nitrate/TMAO reductase-like tetraheme cytochrome c subunit